jgi:hypothetical protein
VNENRNQDREPRQQARTKHPDEWQRDLNPDHLAGQNIGRVAAETTDSDRTAFHLRKNGQRDLPGLHDEELKQVPLVAEGARLQQGGTYIDLNAHQPEEFTATGDMAATSDTAYVPKDRVPYEIWNRLTGKSQRSR